jgi:acetylornithine deacetylase/succinyl-diaminopimelate desuccinylase-like protein
MKEILKKLVEFKTTHQEENKGEFDKAFEFIISQIKDFVKGYKLVESNGYKSLILWKEEKPEIVYMCHLDVVPARDEDFIFRETKGKFYGRGVFDDKFAIAVLIETLKDLK